MTQTVKMNELFSPAALASQVLSSQSPRENPGDRLYGLTGQTEIWEKLIEICVFMSVMMSYENHQYFMQLAMKNVVAQAKFIQP